MGPNVWEGLLLYNYLAPSRTDQPQPCPCPADTHIAKQQHQDRDEALCSPKQETLNILTKAASLGLGLRA